MSDTAPELNARLFAIVCEEIAKKIEPRNEIGCASLALDIIRAIVANGFDIIECPKLDKPTL